VFPTPDGDAKRIHRGFILVRVKEGPTSSGERRVLYFFAPKCLCRGYKPGEREPVPSLKGRALRSVA
jgi:hypothetical protein